VQRGLAETLLLVCALTDAELDTMHAEVASLIRVDWADVWKDGLALTSVAFLCEVRDQIAKYHASLSALIENDPGC